MIRRLQWELVHEEYTKIHGDMRNTREETDKINTAISTNINSIMQLSTLVVARGFQIGVNSKMGEGDNDSDTTIFAACLTGMCPFLYGTSDFDDVYQGIDHIANTYLNQEYAPKIAASDVFERELDESKEFVSYHFGEIIKDFGEIKQRVSNFPVIIKIVEAFACGTMLGLAIQRVRNSEGYKEDGTFDPFYRYCLSLRDLVTPKKE